MLVELVDAWSTDGNYSHGFLIVPLAGYFAWERRARLSRAATRPNALGLLVVAGSLAVLIVGILGSELFLTRLSLIGTIVGSVLFLFGWPVIRILAFPLGILLLMVPLPAIIFNQITFPLQLWASQFGEFVLNTSRIPVLREGNVLISPTPRSKSLKRARHSIAHLVADARNRVRIFHGPARPSGRSSPSPRFRSRLSPTESGGRNRDRRPLLRPGRGQASSTSFPAGCCSWSPFVACPRAAHHHPFDTGADFRERGSGRRIGTMLNRAMLSRSCSGNSRRSRRRATQEAVPARASFDTFPMQVDGWKGRQEPPFMDDILAVLGVDDYLTHLLERSRTSRLYVGYWGKQSRGETIRSQINGHPGSGWQPLSKGASQLGVAEAEGAAPRQNSINRYVIQKGLDRQLVLYWYQSHGRVVASEYVGKFYLVKDAIELNRTDAAIVRVIVPIATDDPDAVEAEQEGVQFVKSLFPVLNAYLPV